MRLDGIGRPMQTESITVCTKEDRRSAKVTGNNVKYIFWHEAPKNPVVLTFLTLVGCRKGLLRHEQTARPLDKLYEFAY